MLAMWGPTYDWAMNEYSQIMFSINRKCGANWVKQTLCVTQEANTDHKYLSELTTLEMTGSLRNFEAFLFVIPLSTFLALRHKS